MNYDNLNYLNKFVFTYSRTCLFMFIFHSCWRTHGNNNVSWAIFSQSIYKHVTRSIKTTDVPPRHVIVDIFAYLKIHQKLNKCHIVYSGWFVNFSTMNLDRQCVFAIIYKQSKIYLRNQNGEIPYCITMFCSCSILA